MGFTQEIFKRATIKGITDYLLFGLKPEVNEKSYKERLDETYLAFEKIALQYDGEAHSKLLNAANDMTYETTTVYTEIGLQAGILLMKDFIQNVGIDYDENKIDYKEKYDSLSRKVTIALAILEDFKDENVKKASDILKSEQNKETTSHK